jgi:hypothetical protein
MSELRSAVESLRSEVLAELPDAVIEEDFAELHRAIEQLEVERLRRLAELDRRRLFERDGHLSAAAWVARTFKVPWGTARRSVRVAQALEEMPATRRSLTEGELSLSAAEVLAEARDADPEAFGRSEGQLVEAARIHSMPDLRRVVGFWRESAARERSLDGEERLRARRRLHVSPTFLGMVRGDFDLDPEGGETLLDALRAFLDAEARSAGSDDDRTPAQRRADALVEIARQWLDLAERPTLGGERPHVTMTIAAEALRAGSGELDHAGAVSSSVARRLACDAAVMRVVLSARSEPLDVGRRTKVVPPSMRRAVIVRDRTCRFPGCDRPHPWCDAHHIVHWADGGPTAASNLVLLCRRHHRLVHRGSGGFTLELDDGGRPVFRRPDGSVLAEDRAPP